jgi:hypothetical protein
MLFREYVELLYRAYLEDRGLIRRLRDKLQDATYLDDLENDPELQNWQTVDPSSLDPRKHQKSKYYPSLYDPQQGVRVYEENQYTNQSEKAKRVLDLVKKSHKRWRSNQRRKEGDQI